MAFTFKKQVTRFLQRCAQQPLAVQYEVRINYTYDLGLKMYFYPFSRCHLVIFKDHLVIFRYKIFPIPMSYRPEVICKNRTAFEKMYMNFAVFVPEHISFEKGRKPRVNLSVNDPFNPRIRIRYVFKNLSQEHIGLIKNFSG
jgi:hypothetical protein